MEPGIKPWFFVQIIVLVKSHKLDLLQKFPNTPPPAPPRLRGYGVHTLSEFV
ncbi:hypothetical protein NIES4103_52100 [Nostoc sp. NIES-4103]|nr:hypothetical protein NIES4103_52100 [Nostoc sp. NIES-4103]